MFRYFLEISYRGTKYHGWQIQNNANSVQAEIERVLSSLFSNKKIETIGCGRTDTGVHAKQFFLHFDAPNEIISNVEFVGKLNRMLPNDIVAIKLIPVHAEAHARFDADSRSYEYHIIAKKNAFEEDLSWLVFAKLDLTLMNEAAQLLIAENDFASFCKAGAQNKTTICKLTQAVWIQEDDRIIFKITADRFLRNMVRAIVGTLVLVGKQQINSDDFKKIVQSKNRSDAGESVPAAGLFLTKITYPYLRAE